MLPFTARERQAALFAVLVLIAGLSLKMIFAIAPAVPAALQVLDAVVYRPKIAINRAGYQELLAVPHIGPAAAARIINYRRAHGKIGNPDALAAALRKKPGALGALSGAFRWD
ncbi:MAG: helix-hairpin-helix domain-containing protein [Candidatus Omnitrophota bacterium]